MAKHETIYPTEKELEAIQGPRLKKFYFYLILKQADEKAQEID